MAAPKFKQLRRSYGFDEVAIVPGDITANPDQTNIDFRIDKFTFSIPIIASAMDAVTDVNFAVLVSKLGGLAVLHLEGVQTRYDNPQEALAEIAQATDDKVTPLLQKIYSQPIKENLIGERVQAIKKGGAICAVSATPANTKSFAPITAEAGADILFVQSTVTSARHVSKSYRGLIFEELCKSTPMPIIVGNCVSYSACLALLRTAFAAGADAVMLGSIFAQAKEAPGLGYHWGMSHPHPALPRGTRIKVGTTGTLEQILFGPTSVTDGSQNLVGALRTAMGICGVLTIQEMHNVEMVIAPAIVTEGKSWQLLQS